MSPNTQFGTEDGRVLVDPDSLVFGTPANSQASHSPQNTERAATNAPPVRFPSLDLESLTSTLVHYFETMGMDAESAQFSGIRIAALTLDSFRDAEGTPSQEHLQRRALAIALAETEPKNRTSPTQLGLPQVLPEEQRREMSPAMKVEPWISVSATSVWRWISGRGMAV